MLTSSMLLALVLVTVAVAALVVVMERARRRLPIRFAERQAGTRVLPSQSADLALKLNPAGIMPTVVASWLSSIVVVAVSMAALLAGQDGGWIGDLTFGLGHGTPLHLLVMGGHHPLLHLRLHRLRLRPGATWRKSSKNTAAPCRRSPREKRRPRISISVISRTTAIGAAYLALLMLLPEILIRYSGTTFYFPSMSLLILVCATLDIEAQVRAERRLAPA